MSAKLHLDQKTRWALALVVLMLLSLLVLAVFKYIETVTEKNIHTDAGPVDERLIIIDGRSTLVDPAELGKVMASWVRSRREKTLSFELSDQSFVANSAVPSQLTVIRVHQIVEASKVDPALTIGIVVPTNVARRPIQELEEQRAAGLRRVLVSNGANASHVTVKDEREDLAAAKSPHLTVLLSK